MFIPIASPSWWPQVRVVSSGGGVEWSLGGSRRGRVVGLVRVIVVTAVISAVVRATATLKSVHKFGESVNRVTFLIVELVHAFVVIDHSIFCWRNIKFKIFCENTFWKFTFEIIIAVHRLAMYGVDSQEGKSQKEGNVLQSVHQRITLAIFKKDPTIW